MIRCDGAVYCPWSALCPHMLLEAPVLQFIHQFEEGDEIALFGAVGAEKNIEGLKVQGCLSDGPKAFDFDVFQFGHTVPLLFGERGRALRSYLPKGTSSKVSMRAVDRLPALSREKKMKV